MLEQLEYIKKWCLQDQSALSSRDVADAVVRMIDDLSLTRAAELRVQTDNGADVPLPVNGTSDRICPSCGGKGAFVFDNYPLTECRVCDGTGHISD